MLPRVNRMSRLSVTCYKPYSQVNKGRHVLKTLDELVLRNDDISKMQLLDTAR
jgi:hypothetical protein